MLCINKSNMGQDDQLDYFTPCASNHLAPYQTFHFNLFSVQNHLHVQAVNSKAENNVS